MIKLPKSQSSSMWPFGGAKEDPDTCNGVKLYAFNYNTRDLKLVNHKELRKNSLSMHLHGMHDILVGVESMDDPIQFVEVVYATFLSLHKYYLCYPKMYGLNCHEWKFDETNKVK